LAGRRAGRPRDEQADPAGAVLILDRLGDAKVGQPAAALEPAVELPDALLLDAVGGPLEVIHSPLCYSASLPETVRLPHGTKAPV
jgi:hypothetical protein